MTMNHKRITNQILEQTNYTLNSTLNYLFNISNMKKLFSYLLISSMVVLSSCTNYDDQFDDLNTQINSLKSQIEGFSSLSSGLTALQGTVAALQSAVASLPQTATPATDISGLEASVAALQTALSGAATSAQVAALTADLAVTQAALEASVAANATASAAATAATADNATDIAALATSLEALSTTIAELKAKLDTVSTAEEIAALSAGLVLAQADLTAIIASSNFYESQLDVTTPAELDFASQLGSKVQFLSKGLKITQTATMDATKLTALMSKIRNVSGAIVYSSSATTTTKASFANLTGAGSIDFTQDGDISLPSLETVGGVLEINGTLTTLTVSLPKLTSATAAMVFNTLSNATTFSMPVMVNHDFALDIAIDNAGTADLSAFTNATAFDGTAGGGQDLSVNASTLTAPVYAKGKITADRLTSVDLPKWQMDAGSSFKRAATVVLPSVKPVYTSAVLTTGYEIAIQDIFDAATSVHIIAAAAVKASAPTHMSVKSTSTKLETLILGGTYATVEVTGSDVTSITFDGTAKDVKINATDIETLSIPYTSAALGTLAITANTKLTSVTADKVAALKGFTLTGNSDLTDISFAALTAASATGASVSISGNDLVLESVSAAQTAPVVAKKIVSADFTKLKSFLTSAISKVGVTAQEVNVSVDLDDVLKSYTDAGIEQDPIATDKVISAYKYLAFTTNAVGAVAKVEEMYITELSADSTFKVDGESVSIIGETGLTNYYDITAWANSAATAAQLSAVGLSVTATGKGQKTGTFTFADTNLTNVSAVVNFSAGMETVSVTTGSASSTASIATALKAALDLEFGVVSKYYTVDATSQVLKFTSNAKGSHRQPFASTMTAKVLSGTVGATAISFAAASTVIDNSIEATDAAYIQFTSTVAGTDGAKTITVVGPATLSATLLAASGIATGYDGDDETYTAAVESSANTIGNADAQTAAKVNNVQYLN